jgi:hypothetical protein
MKNMARRENNGDNNVSAGNSRRGGGRWQRIVRNSEKKAHENHVLYVCSLLQWLILIILLNSINGKQA